MLLLRVLLAAVSGLALSAAFEPLTWAPLIIPAVAGLLLSCVGERPGRAWMPGLAFGVAFSFTHMVWMQAIGMDAWVAISTVESVFYAALGSALAFVARRAWWPLAVPALWVTMELLRSTWPLSGMPWGRLGFGTIDTVVAPLTAYVGTVGVSALLAAAAALLAWVVRGGWHRPGLAAALAIVLLVPVGAAWLWPFTPARDGEFTVAAVQGNVPGDGTDIVGDHRQVTANHVAATVDLAARIDAGEADVPDLVIWPENSTAVDPFRDDEVGSGIREASAAIGLPILVGAMVDGPADSSLNQGILWDPETGAGQRYTKQNPVPFGEYIPWRDLLLERTFGKLRLIARDQRRGTASDPIQVGDVGITDSICFDIAYDDGIFASVLAGGDLMVVQTSNAMFIKTSQIDQQFAITRIRAIETGRAVAVAATNGVSGLIAPDGRVLDLAQPRTQDVLLGTLPLSSTTTPALVLTPALKLLAYAGSIVAVLLAAVTYRGRRHEAAPADRAEGELTSV